jgi:hypothetical protein
MLLCEANIALEICGSICTDGTLAMLWKNSGFVAYAKKQILHNKITQIVYSTVMHLLERLCLECWSTLCFLWRTVNFIRGRALNHHIFCTVCKETGAKHTVLFHDEVEVVFFFMAECLFMFLKCTKKQISFFVTKAVIWRKALRTVHASFAQYTWEMYLHIWMSRIHLCKELGWTW